MHKAAVHAQAYRQVVVVTEKPFGRRRLDGAAETVGRGPGAIDFAQDTRRPERARVGDRLSPDRGQVGHRAVEIGKAQQCRIGTHCWIVRSVRAVAVHVALTEVAKISDGLIGPGVGRLPGRTRGQKGQLILRRLWNSVDACPVLAEHLHRRCRRGTKIIVGTGEGDVKFGLIAARAEISVDAA